MKRLLFFLVLVFFLFAAWPSIEHEIHKIDDESFVGNIKDKIESVVTSPEFTLALNTIQDEIKQFIDKLNDDKSTKDRQVEPETDNDEKLILSPPQNQTFSIANIELSDSKTNIEQQVGEAVRVTENEYGVNWYTYHQEYQQFIMVAYDGKNQVVGLYTNQDLISSNQDIKLGTTKEEVLNQLEEPLHSMQKGLTFYRLPDDRDYELFHIDSSYVTIYFDKHQNNTVTAIQIIDEKLENNKKNFYSNGNPELNEGFEYQLFDLTNAERVKYGLKALTWDKTATVAARKHSNDMAEHHFFNHTNQKGESPFDRMASAGINFTVAGENLAYGQFNSINAHEGLMNSKGHRKNILKADYEYLGVGVAFNDENQPYYTENFFTD